MFSLTVFAAIFQELAACTASKVSFFWYDTSRERSSVVSQKNCPSAVLFLDSELQEPQDSEPLRSETSKSGSS